MTTGAHLWDHMGDAPVILVPCLHRPFVPPVESLAPDMRSRHGAELAYAERIRGASIYPAVQNIILACRALGLGTTITTNHIRCEDAVRALLRLPDDVDSFAMMPIGWPIDPFGPLSRRPLSEVVHADGWGNAWPGVTGVHDRLHHRVRREWRNLEEVMGDRSRSTRPTELGAVGRGCVAANAIGLLEARQMLSRAAPWLRSASSGSDVGGGSARAVSAINRRQARCGRRRAIARCARGTRSCRYGGSRKTRLAASPGGTASASIARTVLRSNARQAAMLARRAASAARSCSMKVACAAPRDSASRPNAPVPANTSSARAPSTDSRPPHGACSSMSNSAWRTRSAVGRVAAPWGAIKARPRHVPATILTGRDRRCGAAREGGGPVPWPPLSRG